MKIPSSPSIERLGMDECTGRIGLILDKSKEQRVKYHLQRLFSQHMKGFYFLQLEPEFMADKGLDIVPFYSDEEKNSSEIFDNY